MFCHLFFVKLPIQTKVVKTFKSFKTKHKNSVNFLRSFSLILQLCHPLQSKVNKVLLTKSIFLVVNWNKKKETHNFATSSKRLRFIYFAFRQSWSKLKEAPFIREEIIPSNYLNYAASFPHRFIFMLLIWKVITLKWIEGWSFMKIFLLWTMTEENCFEIEWNLLPSVG